MSSVQVLAPAKLNLGLSILGKRSDGYHEIDTIMAMIDLSDEITLSQGMPGRISISGMDAVPTASNLMWKAARLWAAAAGITPGWHITIEKRIPSPAGIGGGSSDAVAVLRALQQMHEAPLSTEQLHEVAGQVGADCPFFLYSPCSRATGIGTDIEPIDPPTGWVVLAVPGITSQAKTASLYGALEPKDYGDSARINSVQQQIASGGLAGKSLPNSFLNPAAAAFPELDSLIPLFFDVAGSLSLSGSGPAIYAITSEEDEARAWVDSLKHRIAEGVDIHVGRFLQEVPAPEMMRDRP